MWLPERTRDILHGNPTIQPVATAGTSILSKGSKRKTDESIGPLPDLELDENTESECDQLQPPDSVLLCNMIFVQVQILSFLFFILNQNYFVLFAF